MVRVVRVRVRVHGRGVDPDWNPGGRIRDWIYVALDDVPEFRLHLIVSPSECEYPRPILTPAELRHPVHM